MVIGTSAIIDTEIDELVVRTAVFLIIRLSFGADIKKWFRYHLTFSFQFHHTQMDGAHAGRFLANLQKEINNLC